MNARKGRHASSTTMLGKKAEAEYAAFRKKANEEYAAAMQQAWQKMGVKASLYPALRSQIEGKSVKKQVTMLLDFVQTAFDYATDQEQFGYERPLFGDESFYYPKNDCEDRSILFSILVRDLVKLDVALVHWPGHLATAVAFPEQVEGDHFTLDGRNYTVCSPTYVGAGIGMTMPDFKNVNAELILLK